MLVGAPAAIAQANVTAQVQHQIAILVAQRARNHLQREGRHRFPVVDDYQGSAAHDRIDIRCLIEESDTCTTLGEAR